MAETLVLGLDCKLFYNTVDISGGTGTISVPVWVEVVELRDATLNLAQSEADHSTRASGGLEIMEPSLTQVSIDFLLKWTNDNTFCKLLWDKFWAKEPMDFLALTGADDDTTARGVRGDFKIFGFPQNQNLADPVDCNIVLKPSRSLRSNFVAKAAGA